MTNLKFVQITSALLHQIISLMTIFEHAKLVVQFITDAELIKQRVNQLFPCRNNFC